MTTTFPHQPGFAVNAHGPIAGRLFDLLYAHRDTDEKCDYCLIYLDSLNDLVGNLREAGAA
jgi:hypothetical protein